jgi:CheY-like chemotaxis protein
MKIPIVDTVDRGQKAIALIQERFFNNKCCPNYKIIFMDMDMPEMDGIETTKGILSFYN